MFKPVLVLIIYIYYLRHSGTNLGDEERRMAWEDFGELIALQVACSAMQQLWPCWP